MKKQNYGKGAVGKRSPPQDNGYAERIPETYNRIYQTWSSFRQDLENQIDKNLRRQQSMYEDFFGRWNRLSGEVGSWIDRESVNEAQKEFYNIWRNYSNKIGPRLARAMSDGLQGYGSISTSLEQYSRKVGKEVQDLADWKGEPKKVEQLYNAWLEFGKTVKKQMEAAMNQEWSEAEQLSKTWFEFTNRMTQLMSNLNQKDRDYSDLWNLWQKFSGNIGDSLTKVMNGTSQDIDNLQKTWNSYYAKVEKEMMKLANDIGLSYEELYSRFLEQQSKSLQQMSQWWQVTSEAARKELNALEGRLLNLEKKVKENTR